MSPQTHDSINEFLSAMVAHRLRPILPDLIGPDRTGFIAERFIGDNTNLVYDIIGYCESEKMPWLIIIVELAKAFDTIE